LPAGLARFRRCDTLDRARVWVTEIRDFERLFSSAQPALSGLASGWLPRYPAKSGESISRGSITKTGSQHAAAAAGRGPRGKTTGCRRGVRPRRYETRQDGQSAEILADRLGTPNASPSHAHAATRGMAKARQRRDRRSGPRGSAGLHLGQPRPLITPPQAFLREPPGGNVAAWSPARAQVRTMGKPSPATARS